MIIDHIRFSNIYCGLSPEISAGLHFLKQKNLSELPVGRYEVPGSKAYAMIQEHQTRLREKTSWEAHRKYIDLQLIIRGEEQIAYNDIQKLKMGEFHEKDDYVLGEGEGTLLPLHPNEFMLLFPQDAHIPSLAMDGIPSLVKKVVVKIPVTESA